MKSIRHSNARRFGSTLVELLTTITVLTILLGLCAGLIKLLLKLDQSGRDALAVSTDASRLTATFRADAHRSASAPPPQSAPDRLVLTWPDDQSVQYTIRANDILREVRQGAQVRQRESYRLPHRSSAKLEVAVEASRSLVSIVIDRGSSVGHADRIDAEVGRFDRSIARQP